jgi:hypothetical protein
MYIKNRTVVSHFQLSWVGYIEISLRRHRLLYFLVVTEITSDEYIGNVSIQMLPNSLLIKRNLCLLQRMVYQICVNEI